ncbi:hypothetical protein P7L54_13950 [Acinetobacter bereziniae]|uniref:hypothetical protein n=1 Tax=Acinetobacter bereziniae TaxID=106648 RepID=UPI001D0E9728|nr:hypothetical protein [Acinetobacter bereziniae]MDG3557050.1 hypothetical protein [Acinetobacter bereziniae]UUN94849.1 hypothetical protein I9189_006630 [Acinetobacter bereziniae]
MDKFEPKETGLKRTVWLFEREILANLEKTDLKDHHKVLSFNIFSMEYELNPEFDNGRADAIVMRDTANHWLKMWFVAFQTCASEKMQSRQAEINKLQSQINEMAEVGLSQESVIRGKDKRIESALSELESLHNKKWAEWKEQADMYSQGEANAYEHAMQILEKVLRGEHE